MARRPSPATTARRDAILCAVRDGALVTTLEVCRAICSVCRAAEPARSYHCYPRVYQDLRALNRAGLVGWYPAGDGYPQATWLLTMEARERFVLDDLEALWVADL